jgi:hypothetical protein
VLNYCCAEGDKSMTTSPPCPSAAEERDAAALRHSRNTRSNLDGTPVEDKIAMSDFADGWDACLKSKVVAEMVEAMEMGAFHHSTCPWHDGKDCCCAKQKVDRALLAYYAAIGKEK